MRDIKLRNDVAERVPVFLGQTTFDTTHVKDVNIWPNRAGHSIANLVSTTTSRVDVHDRRAAQDELYAFQRYGVVHLGERDWEVGRKLHSVPWSRLPDKNFRESIIIEVGNDQI